MTIQVWCDGSIRPPNPGGTGYGGWVAKDADGQVIHEQSVALGTHPKMSNNVAEYGAVWDALTFLRKEHDGEKITIFTDSMIVVRQLQGDWNCHAVHLQRIYCTVNSLAKSFTICPQFAWVPREQNVEADILSKALWQPASRESKRR